VNLPTRIDETSLVSRPALVFEFIFGKYKITWRPLCGRSGVCLYIYIGAAGRSEGGRGRPEGGRGAAGGRPGGRPGACGGRPGAARGARGHQRRPEAILGVIFRANLPKVMEGLSNIDVSEFARHARHARFARFSSRNGGSKCWSEPTFHARRGSGWR